MALQLAREKASVRGQTAAQSQQERRRRKALMARQVWVFLDEINTCGCLGLFKEMICDGTMNGMALPPDLGESPPL